MENNENVICPLCNDTVDKLLYRFHIDNERQVIDRIKTHNPTWSDADGTCSRCVDYYHTEIIREQRLLPEIGPYFPVKSADDFVILPTPLRLDADPRFTGKGVCICFIDSGFCAHPDLTAQRNRIKKIVDIAVSNTLPTDAAAWHGTMTTVVCAGDGYLSNGLYRGIASDAELVLLKVQDDNGRISTDNIVKALQWVLLHHKEYNIRIINMSLGGDDVISHKESVIDKLAEELIKLGISIVAAVGNDEQGFIKPPANALNVIAVGGINDHNKLDSTNDAYHSSFGKTVDELMKPEILAHAIWMAAPILPGTPEEKEAVTLNELIKSADTELPARLKTRIQDTRLDKNLVQATDAGVIRTAIINRIQQCKYIAPYYMHVDGTSFAAPIVSSIIAQLLEINPELTPAAIRHILFSSAKRIKSIAAERQGFGVVQARKALLKVLKKETFLNSFKSPMIDTKRKSISFLVQNECATQISVAGSFNHWAQDVLLMEPCKNGIWKIEIPLLPAGRYVYKFYIDEHFWMEDIDNPYREPDGLSGFNSILIVEN